LSAPAPGGRELFPENKLLIATQNPGKLREITALLAGLPLAVMSPSALDRPLPPVSEDGLTYEANARTKADSACQATGLAVLADDSGLEVAGPGARRGALGTLRRPHRHRLGEQPAAPGAALRRTRCCAPSPLRLPRCSACRRDSSDHDRCGQGRITDAERGPHGFGYDPLFFYPPFGCTFGEAHAADKESASHRGAAFRAMAAEIRSLLTADVDSGSY
jgi:XTP/dITP diphosphohydrolase